MIEIQESTTERSGGRNPATLPSERYIRLSSIQVDLRKEEVTKDGSRLKVSGHAYKALVALLERPGQIVSRDVIRDCLRPSNDGADYDASVTAAMSTLRRMLGDTYRQPLYIKTIPRKGYVLIGDPEFSDAPHGLPKVNTVQPNLPHQSPAQTWFRQLSARFRVWSIPWAVGIILVGMFIGVWISAFWISRQH